MTLPAIVTASIPTPTPQHAASLSPQQLEEHRRAIAFEVEIVLSAYFQPNESAEIRDGQLAWWCDELEDWTREQIVTGLRTWNRENSRRRPTPGDITGLLKQMRGRKVARQLQAEAERQEARDAAEKERISPERAAQIVAEAGFTPRRFGGES